MTSIMTRLGLSEWAAGQDQPHITVNEFAAVGFLLEVAAKAKGTSTPPASPEEGEVHIVGASPTGAWSSFSQDNLAVYQNGAWIEVTVVDRLSLFVDDGGGGLRLWRYDGTASPAAWTEVLLGSSANVVKTDTTATLSVGYSHTVYDLGTISSGTVTPSEANGAMQKLVNGGAFTLDPPANSTSIALHVTNNASAGAITTTGFTITTGDALTTVNGDAFLLYLNKVGAASHLHVVALQ